MNDEAEIKEKILMLAEEKFHQFGFSKVTMEEIASDLAISKKTLYKNFSNKEHILKEIFEQNKCEFEGFIDDLLQNGELEFIDKLKTLMDYIVKNSPKFNGQLIIDLKKNHPVLWKEIEDFRHKKAYGQISTLLNEGKIAGVFRNDIKAEVITIIYMSAIHGLINPEVLAVLPITFEQVHKIVTQILMEGILSEEGRNKYKSNKIFYDKNEDTNL